MNWKNLADRGEGSSAVMVRFQRNIKRMGKGTRPATMVATEMAVLHGAVEMIDRGNHDDINRFTAATAGIATVEHPQVKYENLS